MKITIPVQVFEKHAIRGDILFDMTNAEIVDMMARWALSSEMASLSNSCHSIIIVLSIRENALVYGDVLRLEKAIHKMHRTTAGKTLMKLAPTNMLMVMITMSLNQPVDAASAPHSMVPLPHMQEQPIGDETSAMCPPTGVVMYLNQA